MKSGLLLLLLIGICNQAGAKVEGELGQILKDFSYKESLPAPLKSTESALVFASYAKINFYLGQEKKQFLQTRAEISISNPSTYDGTTFSGEPSSGTNMNQFFDGAASYNYNLGENYFMGAGLGFHYWDRFLNGGSGYREIYSWAYYLLTLGGRFRINENWDCGLQTSFKQMFAGTIYIIFSETVESGDNTSLSLGNRGGYLIEIPLSYKFSDSKVKLALTPFYAYSEIGASDVKYNATPTNKGKLGNIQEPSSKTQEIGLQVGLNFPFE